MKPVFVQAHNVGPKQKPTTILVKPSFTTGRKGAANGIAQAWHKAYNKVDSCHYVVDEKQTLHCVPDDRSAFPYGYMPFTNAIVVNMCYDPPNRPTNAVLLNTAKLIAQLCKEHKIKPKLLDDEQVSYWGKKKRRSRGGIDVLDCWPVPETDFEIYIKAAYKNL